MSSSTNKGLDTTVAHGTRQNDRFSACHVLREGGISCYIWCEDALKHFGVPTGVFGLYLLVNNTHEAANCLIKHGWTPPPSDFEAPYNDIEEDTHYLIKAQNATASNTTIDAAKSIVGLLSVTDWKIQLPISYSPYQVKLRDENLFTPPLLELLEAMISKWLDTPDSQPRFQERLGIFLAYLYRYVPALREPGFTQSLKLEHQRYHEDVLSGVSTQGFKFRDHSKKHRDEVTRLSRYDKQACFSAPTA